MPILMLSAAGAALTQSPAPAQGQGDDRATVALTFDDLPAHGPLPPGLTRVDVASRIIDALRSHHAPPIYGFVNAKDLVEHPEDAQVLQAWRDAGFPLGNHAYSHMDLHANSAEAFEQDILADEATLRKFMDGQDWRWFRYPFLREGDTPDKHRAIRAFLQQHAYRVAQVTISFDDYAYNEPYVRCLAKQDTPSIEWLQESYLTRAAESLTRAQEASRQLFQHDVPHVMLLHIGAFETVMLPKLLDLLQQRRFDLVALPDAASDRIYAIDPDLPDNWNGTFLQQLMRARHLPPMPPAAAVFERLGAICR